MNSRLLIILGILILTTSLFAISEVDARCSGPYPCRGPDPPPLSAEIAFRSDTIALGTPVNVSYGVDALDGYDENNTENPCELGLQYLKPNDGIVDYLNNSKHKAPFLYEFQIEKYYKNEDSGDVLRVVGIEKINGQYAKQLSYGYKIIPELGEELLLYMRHFDEFVFGINCTISDVYFVDELQGSIWGWNENDFKPDIYPGDVKIPSLKEQNTYMRFEKNNQISPSMWDLISCPLGMEPMYRLYVGLPFCVTSETADEIEQRGWAKRFSYFWTFNGFSYKDTENYELWRK